MAMRKRRITPTAGAKGEAGQKPASSAPKKGGIKKRTNLPIEPDVPDFGGELGQVIEKMTASGQYGTPFIKGSSKRLERGRTRTGILAFDLALGGGWTKSAVHMLYGEKSSGKSTTALQSIATLHAQDDQACAAWVDIEGTLDKAWAAKIGVDLERLVVIEPEAGEHAVDLADALIRSREIMMLATDSIAMLIPMKELEESAEQETMALQARLMGKYSRKINNAVLKERSRRGHLVTVLNINQIRMKVGLVFGDPRVLPGGKSTEFATTQQAEVKNKEIRGKDDDGNEVVLYNEHNVKITKNKGGGPMKEAAFKLIRTSGHDNLPETWVDQAKTVHRFGTQAGLITGTAGAFEVEGVGKFKGGPAFNRWALEDTAGYTQLQAQIIESFRNRWGL